MWTLLQLIVLVAGLVLFKLGKDARAEKRGMGAEAEFNGHMAVGVVFLVLVAVSVVIERTASLR